jgi:hypothetical protein
MKKMKIQENSFYLGKKIIACENIINFSTNKIVRVRTRYCGVIEKIENDIVYIYDKSNPINYQNYSLKYSDFCKWVLQGLYKIRTV